MTLCVISHQAVLISSLSANTDIGLKSRAPVWETPRTQREASITHRIEPFVWLPANPGCFSHAFTIYQDIPTPPLPYVTSLASAPLYLQGYFNSRQECESWWPVGSRPHLSCPYSPFFTLQLQKAFLGLNCSAKHSQGFGGKHTELSLGFIYPHHKPLFHPFCFSYTNSPCVVFSWFSIWGFFGVCSLLEEGLRNKWVASLERQEKKKRHQEKFLPKIVLNLVVP